MANPERQGGEPKLKIGEMPNPRYMHEAVDATGDVNIGWIGMQAYALDSEVKDFLWWRNFQVGDLNDDAARHDAAAFVARLKLEMKADSAIGKAIDLERCNPDTGYVDVVEEQGVYGIYVEADKRLMFNFMTMMNGVRTEGQLRRSKPVLFDAAFQEAKKVLPRPEAKLNQ